MCMGIALYAIIKFYIKEKILIRNVDSWKKWDCWFLKTNERVSFAQVSDMNQGPLVD